jgi:hypothetical protein
MHQDYEYDEERQAAANTKYNYVRVYRLLTGSLLTLRLPEPMNYFYATAWVKINYKGWITLSCHIIDPEDEY